MTDKLTRFRDFVEQVRAATDIAEIVGKDVDLKPAGNTLKGLSPFHTEKHPSFVVWPGTQTWHDFSGGRGLGGDVFSYIQERDKVGFKEAVHTVARSTGIKPPDEDEETYRKELGLIVEQRNVERLLTQAAAYYHFVLPSKIREQWCNERYGFTDETIDQLQLGWANGHLYDHFIEHLKVERSLALKTGLFIETKGGVKDFFQDRLVFPYWKGGQVVYFIARRTEFTGDQEWEQSKYKKLLTHSDRHSYVSESVKNDKFYNEDAAKGADEILITEGVTDCISAMQAEIPCISPVTTRFRKQDLNKLLKLTRHAKQVIICNDSEASGAGAIGALETAVALYKEGRDVRIAVLPRPEGVDKIDVNEFLKDNSKEAFKDVLKQSRRYLEYLINAIPEDTSKIDLSPKLQPVLEHLVRRSPIEQDGYIDLITNRFDIGRRLVKSLLNKLYKEIQPDKNKQPQPDADQHNHKDREAGRFKGEVLEDTDHYFIIAPDGRRQKVSSFQIEPTKRVNTDNGELIIGDVTTDKGTLYRNITFSHEAWRGKQFFHRFLKHADMQWTGNDNNLQGVLRILSRRDVPVCYSTKLLGYLETEFGPRWLIKNLVLGPEGPVDDDLVYIDHGATLSKCLKYKILPEAECKALAQQVLPDLLNLNEPAVVLPVLGWFFATPFKPRLIKILKHFPYLMVFGTSGSGKTTLCNEIFWRMFGIQAGTKAFSVTDTEFALIKRLSSTESVPVFIDEYKPYDMNRRRVNTIHRFLRRIYGGELEERGRPDGSIVSYHLIAPVCLAGEARPNDAALVDRMVAAAPDKNKLEQTPEFKAAYKRLSKLPLGNLAAPYIQFALGRDTETDLELATTITDAVLERIAVGDNVSIRYKDNLRVVTLGLTMYEEFAKHMEVTGIPDHLDVEAAFEASIGDVMDGDQGAKTPLDLFIETCSVMAYNGILVRDKHYAVVDGLTCLHLSSCWDLYLEHCRRIGQPPHVNGRQALRRMLHENHRRGGYVKDCGKQVLLGDSRPRLFAIDLKQAAEFLDVDSFPENTNRTWGGSRYGPESQS
ncbi:MAG: DNA primase [Proteobacteria bacterium]|nr:DNA primase [Pseudomonadota bacterium]